MKKLTAIFLLSAFVINLVGYHLWYHFELKASDKKIEAVLNNEEYADADLISIRIPLSLPYNNSSAGYERISGEVSYKGKIFKYVKRKIENGDFVLLCLPDYNKMQLEQEKNDVVKDSLDQTGNTSDKHGNNQFKYAFSEFEQNLTHVKLRLQSLPLNEYALFNDATFNSLRISAPGQPPDRLS